MIKKHLETVLSKAFEDCQLNGQDMVFLEQPKQREHGHFSTNVAFRLSKQLKQAPPVTAEAYCKALNDYDGFKNRIEFSFINGFINLTLTDAFLWELAFSELRSTPDFPAPTDPILLEYVSANPTGPLHVGHGRWAVLGSSIATLLKATGHKVSEEFYINDAGSQIQKLYDSVAAAKAGNEIPEDGYHGDYIYEIAESGKDPLEANIATQREILDQLEVTFDTWYSEKTLHESGKVEAALSHLKSLGVTYEEGGALWFASTRFGDDKDRVLVKADGAYTYFAVDVAYHYDKTQRGFKRMINLFGADHHGYVARIKAAVNALCEADFSDETFNVVIGQLVNLVRDGEPVRMSKRSGNMVTLKDVVDEIGPDATRFFLVQKSADTHIEFDLELAKKKSSENPVFYVQYAHARLCSVLKKAGEASVPSYTSISCLEEKEKELLLTLCKFYDVMWDAALSLQPYKMAQFAFDLARAFHHFYEACPVLKVEGPLQEQRLALCVLTKDILAQSLTLLGVSAPESM
jgi:arginyl-tRNA synthetase